MSTYLEKATQRQIERDYLGELIADFEKTNGPADPEAVAAKRVKLTAPAPLPVLGRLREPTPSSSTARASPGPSSATARSTSGSAPPVTPIGSHLPALYLLSGAGCAPGAACRDPCR